VYRLERLCANRLGRYPAWSITFCTRKCVARLMRGLSFNTIETVATDTLAHLATSRRLTGLATDTRAIIGENSSGSASTVDDAVARLGIKRGFLKAS
jgi:hypothetical protein